MKLQIKGCSLSYVFTVSLTCISNLFPQGYYKRTDSYIPIRNWKRVGCHAVPMIHSTMLLDLRRHAGRALAFYPVHQLYPWILDDILAFSFSARQAGKLRCTAQTHRSDVWWKGHCCLPTATRKNIKPSTPSSKHHKALTLETPSMDVSQTELKLTQWSII